MLKDFSDNSKTEGVVKARFMLLGLEGVWRLPISNN